MAVFEEKACKEKYQVGVAMNIDFLKCYSSSCIVLTGMTKRVLCVGLTCLDMVQTVQNYPVEDSDQRSVEARWQRGGNASNNCTVLAQIGVPCEFLGTLGKDLTLQFLQDDFSHHQIETGRCPQVAEGSCPVSIVLLSAQTGSRTIVHHPGTIPELSLEQFKQLDMTQYSWIHFEGRNVAGVESMLSHVSSLGAGRPVTSVELEKPRLELSRLLPLADFVFLGRDFAEARGWTSGQEAVTAAAREARPGASVVCAWGVLGAWGVEGVDAPLLHSPAFPPACVVDSLGAGDTFVAGLVASQVAGHHLATSLSLACRLAGAKVGLTGFEGLISKWQNAMQECVEK